MRRVLVAAVIAVAVQPVAAQNIAIGIRLAGPVRLGVGTEDRAKALTTVILRRAGLEPGWIDCLGDRSVDEVCQHTPAPDELMVSILPVQPDRDSCACGVAQRPLDGTPGSFITVYSGCVKRGANSFGADEGTVLSVAIVHEIGHLLLPRGHAFAGIMRAQPTERDLRRAAHGLLLFNARQSRLIQEAVRVRRRLAAATVNPDG